MLRDWLYLPRSPEYALPWLLGPAISMVLAIFGLPAGKATEFQVTWKSTSAYTTSLCAIAVLNALVLWTHVRSQFLTWATAKRPFAGTYTLLTVAYLSFFGFVLIESGQAQITLRHANAFYTERCLLAGACSMLPALLVSALWKSEEPGITNLRLQRSVALDLLGRLEQSSISALDYRALIDVLEGLPTTARSAQSQLIVATDRHLSALWADAAGEIFGALRGKAVDDYYETTIRVTLAPTITANKKILEQDK